MVPDFWGDLTRIQPELRAWSRLWAAASVRKALGGFGADGRLRPRYAVLPRIRSTGPNLEQLRRLGRASVFEAAPGHVLLVGRLDHLELRCLAEVFVHQGGEPQLGGWFRGGLDPVRRVAWSLYNHDRGRDGEDPMPEHTFDEIDAQEPGHFARWKDLGAVLLDAVHRGLAAPHVREILARAFQRVKELGRRRPGDELTQYEHADVRDRLVEEFGMTPRNVDRDLAVLRAPAAVQGAFDRGALPLDLAARVAHLTPAAQAGIAREIEAGRPAAEVVRGHIASAGDPRKAARVAYLRLPRQLEAACPELEGRVDEVELKVADVAARIAILERSGALIEGFLGREEGVRQRHEALLGELEELRRQLGRHGEDRT